MSTITITAETHEKLLKLAEIRDISPDRIAETAIRKYLVRAGMYSAKERLERKTP